MIEYRFIGGDKIISLVTSNCSWPQSSSNGPSSDFLTKTLAVLTFLPMINFAVVTAACPTDVVRSMVTSGSTSSFTGISAPSLSQGSVYDFSVQIGTCDGNYSNCVAIYIDYNQDDDNFILAVDDFLLNCNFRFIVYFLYPPSGLAYGSDSEALAYSFHFKPLCLH